MAAHDTRSPGYDDRMDSNQSDLQDSTPHANGPDGAAGDMGVSSERVGPAGPGQVSTDGVRDSSLVDRDPDDDTPPEQAPGGPEENPGGLDPKAGYSTTDPRSP